MISAELQAITAKITLPKNTHSMVAFQIKKKKLSILKPCKRN